MCQAIFFIFILLNVIIFVWGEIHLVSDLAIILIAAGIVTLLFKRLKQPMVLGYIVAGFLVGPYFDVLPTIIEKESVHQ